MALLDVDVIERVKSELDSFIEKRAREKKKEANRIEAAWAESTRRHNERRWRENCSLWYSHHCHLQAVHQDLADRH